MIRNITNVRGIRCWGAHTGVKPLQRDLAIVYSEVPASATAVFTQNKVVAEPVKISKNHIAGGRAQAIVVNSGNANACTGEQGFMAAEEMAEEAAQGLGIKKELVLIASTGIIGKPFPTKKVVEGIRENIAKLSSKAYAGTMAAHAILTTDTFAKEGFIEFSVENATVNMAGIAKGSGMIHPDMATMLAFIFTDLRISSGLLQKTVNQAVNRSFNMITVDGDTSTNDMVAVLANGLAGNKAIVSENDPGYAEFREALEKLMTHLAKLIVLDGEGASKFIQYEVVNAPDELTARRLARSISSSSLVKTALFGRDPNWGRIIGAAGNAGVPFQYESSDLYFCNENHEIKVMEKGIPMEFDKSCMKEILSDPYLSVKLDLHKGKAVSTGWGSDLTTNYVLLNSIYTS